MVDKYTFDEICESQKFNHDQEFILFTPDIKRKLEMHEELVEFIESISIRELDSQNLIKRVGIIKRAKGSL
jgi:hypothetical protein